MGMGNATIEVNYWIGFDFSFDFGHVWMVVV